MTNQRWVLSATLLLLSVPAFADFQYQQDNGGVVYAADGESPQILSRLPDVNYSRLQRIADLSHPQNARPLTEINPDSYDCDNSHVCQHAWLSDGRFILWAGKIVQNTGDEPAVHVASFQAFGAFAADKHSLYFDGKRSDSNAGEKRVDMATLTRTEIWNLLRDKNNLYYQGRWLGSAAGFRVLRQDPNSAGEFIVLTARRVIVNGVPITADAQTFQIVRWIPGDVLIYRDKTGKHDYEINEGPGCETFNIGLDKVTWLKHERTSAGSDCQVETLTGVDPEYFYYLKGNIGWHKHQIYQVSINALGEGELHVFTPQERPPELKLGDYFYRDLALAADGQLYYQASSGEWLRYNPTAAVWTRVPQTPVGLISLFSSDYQ
ncbi:hypothetical protein PK90_000241 [Salmonella enterica subsp. enterica]|uniref:hypothetical protein n=1 Tax=Salmonella enterica TaxID=28901 RepID=UPI0009AACA97|nr:hypothetical protein [Salmonella enterica]EDT7060518.1 hypothetical protein [Salmonella enterica subsp. enterica]EAU0020402.1 hypothetical protein [Salmonella enterica]EAW9968560.1 hypothetical protein [Salmonella enterica]EBB7943183.1 hypothetical protein [Salmonella enterica]EBC8961966.1 hypothetical protein [Salmonella enterica]